MVQCVNGFTEPSGAEVCACAVTTSAAFSPIMETADRMKKPGIRGNTDASTTRSPWTP